MSDTADATAGSPTATDIPIILRVHLTHATMQALADAAGADILHVKGPAVDGSLRPQRPSRRPGAGPNATEAVPRTSTDADVIVRPEHVKAFIKTAQGHGWRLVTRFSTGSAFKHAATLWHDTLGYVDVHRRFPGVELPDDTAFDVLWGDRQTTQIAHRPVAVPSVEMQRMLLILHGARGSGVDHPDVRNLFSRADADQQARTRALARRMCADVAFAAATGNLADYADHPSHDLWEFFSTPGNRTRLGEWQARMKAERSLVGKVQVAVHSLLVNTDHLGMELHRPPTRREIALEYGHRVGTFAREVGGLVGRRLRRGGPR